MEMKRLVRFPSSLRLKKGDHVEYGGSKGICLGYKIDEGRLYYIIDEDEDKNASFSAI